MRRLSLVALFVVLPACGPGAVEGAAGPEPTPSPTPRVVVTVPPDEAATMTIAEVLRTDERLSFFRDLAQRTMTPIAPSGLDVWDWPAGRMGDHQEGVTVFVPTDAAFAALDPAILAVLEDPDVDNDILYGLIGHHYVHRLYPSEDFRAGRQPTWRRSLSGPVELTLDPLTWGGQPIERTDIRTANGYLHLLGGVVVPDALAEAAAAERGGA